MKRLARSGRSARAGIASAACLATIGFDCSDAPRWQPAHIIREPAIREGSGIVASRQHDGVLWTHNDSGDVARIFALDRTGSLLAEVEVVGATNVDWEDIATDDAGNLYIADTGNNKNKRRDLGVYVMPEPDPGAGRLQHVPITRHVTFFYPEQRAFPDPDERNFDCEALCWDDGKLYVFTKHRSDTRSVLYRLPESDGAAVRLGEFDAGGMVTAADLSPDGRRLLVLTYESLHLFERRNRATELLAGTHHRVLLEGRQCEGVCFDGDDVVFTNEQREMYRLPLATLRKLDTYLPEPPRVEAARVDPAGAGAWWERVASLPLQPDRVDCQPSGSPPAVRVGWTDQGVAVRIDWLTPHEGVWPESVFEILLASEASDHRKAVVYRGTLAGDHVQLTARSADAAADESPGDGWGVPASGWSAGRLWFEAILSVAGDRRLRAGDAVHADIQVFEPVTEASLVPPCGLDDTDPFEWAWAGSSSTEPWTNPRLWGVVTLADRPH